MPNPFTPNFGQAPRYLAGRSLLLDEISDVFDGNLNSPSRTSLIVGARGSGKTALLTALAGTASSKGWIVVDVACLPGMLDDVVTQAEHKAAHLVAEDGLPRITSVSLGQVVSLDLGEPQASVPSWRLRMEALLDVLADRGTGLLVTIDEITPSLQEMVQFAASYQLFVREARPIALLMAGLPHEASALLRDRSVSFLRRASQYYLERIEDFEVEEALLCTIRDAGKDIDHDALVEAAKASQGYPFMMQLVGYRMWQRAGEDGTITVAHAREAIRLARKDMESRVLKATLDELSEVDLAFLAAMLPDPGPSRVADIALRMGKSSKYVSQYRRRLLEQGVIGERGRGLVGFDLPVLREYLPWYLGISEAS